MRQNRFTSLLQTRVSIDVFRAIHAEADRRGWTVALLLRTEIANLARQYGFVQKPPQVERQLSFEGFNA